MGRLCLFFLKHIIYTLQKFEHKTPTGWLYQRRPYWIPVFGQTNEEFFMVLPNNGWQHLARVENVSASCFAWLKIAIFCNIPCIITLQRCLLQSTVLLMLYYSQCTGLYCFCFQRLLQKAEQFLSIINTAVNPSNKIVSLNENWWVVLWTEIIWLKSMKMLELIQTFWISSEGISLFLLQVTLRCFFLPVSLKTTCKYYS